MPTIVEPVRLPSAPPAPSRPRPSSGHPVRAWLLLAAYCLFLFGYGLNRGPFYRTEGLRALVAAEMLRSGNWLVPTLYGEPLLTKPPGHYAAIALLSRPSGEVREWTARLPSALAAAVTVLLFYRWFGRVFGRRGGLVAALILPASLMWLDGAPSAEIDALQVAWVSASLFCLSRAVELAEGDAAAGRQFAWWCGALLCVAGGVLTKWTAPVFFYGTALPFLWKRGRLRLLWGAPHLFGVVVGASLCCAWVAAAVTYAGWEHFADTIRQEALPKLLPGARAGGYPWREAALHPLRIFGGTLPGSAFALLTLRPGFARLWGGDARRLLQLLHCWAWPNWLFWTLAPNHAARHAFPLAPALAGLAALVWLALLTGRSRWPTGAVSPRSCLVALLLAWVIAKLVFVHHTVPERMRHRHPDVTGRSLAEAVPPGETLYLLRVKDESLMFYYGRPARRLSEESLALLPADSAYCLLTEAEWKNWHLRRSAEVMRCLSDSQGEPLVLIRFAERR